MRKEELEKVGLYFIKGSFIKPFKIEINPFFYSSSPFAAPFPLFGIKDIKRGNWEQQIARDGKLNIYFKKNFSLLVMKVTRLKFLN